MEQVIECGCCGAFHRAAFYGDCREDSERLYEVEPREFKEAKPYTEAGEPDNIHMSIWLIPSNVRQ